MSEFASAKEIARLRRVEKAGRALLEQAEFDVQWFDRLCDEGDEAFKLPPGEALPIPADRYTLMYEVVQGFKEALNDGPSPDPLAFNVTLVQVELVRRVAHIVVRAESAGWIEDNMGRIYDDFTPDNDEAFVEDDAGSHMDEVGCGVHGEASKADHVDLTYGQIEGPHAPDCRSTGLPPHACGCDGDEGYHHGLSRRAPMTRLP